MFLKFGSEENIQDLYKHGTIYMNSREFFRRIEDKDLRGDSYEGVHKIKNYGKGSFHIPGINHTVNYQNLHLPQSFDEVWGNIYSLYCLDPRTVPEMFDFKMDERVSKFGSHCLLIKKPNEFISLVKTNARLMHYELFMDFVKYFDKHEFNGELTVFDKPKEFEYQKEFRFYIKRKRIDPLIFKIGSLEDISEIFQTEAILDLKLTPNSEG